MRIPSYKFWFWLFFFLTFLSLFFLRLSAQAMSFPSRVIEIVAEAQAISPPTQPSWTFLDKLQEAKDLVASSSFNLKVGKKDLVYYERRITRNDQGNITSITPKRITDPEREIILVLVDLSTGELETVKITERGNDLVYPEGYQIENVERPNGITNNAWNTCRRIISPSNKAVILNVWPHYVTIKVAKPVKNKAGKVIRTTYTSKEIVENVVYAPYCEQIHVSEFVENGKNYRKSIPIQAMEILRERGVRSKAFPGELIADIESLKPEYFERLPLIEHMDYGEFTLDPKKSAERVDVIIGMNMEQAYKFTCSSAKACGWLQYTRSTWNSMRLKYPSAKLPAFESGVADHLNSMIAAILLHDNNLAKAIKDFGTGILNNPNQVEEILAANYNGGTAKPNSALQASILQSLEDWLITPMRTQTQQYIKKVRYVRENYN